MKIGLVILWIFLSANAFGQGKKKATAPIESLSSDSFGRVSDINNSIRLRKYPFNKAVKIQLVSFVDATGGGQRDPKEKVVYNPIMPKSNMAVCINPFKEIVKLDKTQINKLADIWFNYGPLTANHISEIGSCYSPKNAILFLDEKGKVFDFIEICFSCLHMYDFSQRINANSKCDHTINMIEEVFKKAGIKYGVID